MSTEFFWPIRVYYEDTDAGGVVYYANYLKYYERARTEWLNQMKVNQVELLENDIAFVVTHVEIDYIKPARLNNDLLVKSRIVKVKAASLEFEQALYLVAEKKDLVTEKNEVVAEKKDAHFLQRMSSDEYKGDLNIENTHLLLNRGIVKVACLKLKTFSPCRIPTKVKEEFQRVG